MKILIIPSAKTVSGELQQNFGEIPSVLIPLQGKPVFEHLFEQYRHTVDKIYIVGYEQSDLIEAYLVSRQLNHSVELVVLDRLGSLGYSICFAMKEAFRSCGTVDSILVNFGDTLLNEEVQADENTVYYSKTRHSKTWTTFHHDSGKITQVWDRQEVQYAENYDSFIGVFHFADPSAFLQALEDAGKHNGVYDSFYHAVLTYNELYPYQIKQTQEWMDVGHQEQYIQTAKEVQARFFNTIEIDKQRGILTKKSENQEKFIKEIKWYLKLPSQLQYLIPRIFDYSLDYNDPYVRMEYYSYNTLHDLFVYGNHSLSQWDEIFDSMEQIILDMSRYQVSLGQEEAAASLDAIYIEKTIQRLNSLKHHPQLGRLLTEEIVINGKKFPPLSFYMEILPELLQKNQVYNVNSFQIIHGDLCFSNILYSLSGSTIRLIDPRGEFGKFDIYGDIRYDLAKLSHSVLGRYDFIINDLIDVRMEDNRIRYEIHSNRRNAQIGERFRDRLSKLTDMRVIRLIESLLFLSMVPLHGDYPRRQHVMLAVGVEMLDSFLRGDGSDC
ncbi:hypothetical protein ACFPPD_13500 [Cohnella suwonensis]|uniref:Capsular biosynthesis protein n=1 Tax=Cohnella suwonensis TaxID=696072 RepID=A0ABW0LVJ0_9BACL